MTTPRVFIVRHGETEWSLNGRHTGVSDIPLTANGERRIQATGRALVGRDRLIVPKKLAHIYVSPRRRAQRTFELLHLDLPDPLPWQRLGTSPDASPAPPHTCDARVEVTPAVREWDYGDYEGITSPAIRQIRAAHGIPGTWDIWRDGCPGGESPEDITVRLDALIADLRERFHRPAFAAAETAAAAAAAAGQTTTTSTTSSPSAPPPGDVLIVAHGHILRALAMRWVGAALQDGPTFLLEAGGVGTLSYEHHSIDEPAILLGGAFTVDLASDGTK